MSQEVLFTRATSVAAVIERLLSEACVSVDAALYRLNSPQLARALESALDRGVSVRLVLDRRKFEEDCPARDVVADHRLPFRLSSGRNGPGSKMHHKFVILDRRTVLTGSYNWTLESEEQNYEGLIILRDPKVTDSYAKEFAALWADGEGKGSRE